MGHPKNVGISNELRKSVRNPRTVLCLFPYYVCGPSVSAPLRPAVRLMNFISAVVALLLLCKSAMLHCHQLVQILPVSCIHLFLRVFVSSWV
jgi:hypothetical protein